VAAGHRTHLEQVMRTVAVNRLHPVVGQVFAFDEAPAALAHYAEAATFGKIVVRVAD